MISGFILAMCEMKIVGEIVEREILWKKKMRKTRA